MMTKGNSNDRHSILPICCHFINKKTSGLQIDRQTDHMTSIQHNIPTVLHKEADK